MSGGTFRGVFAGVQNTESPRGDHLDVASEFSKLCIKNKKNVKKVTLEVTPHAAIVRDTKTNDVLHRTPGSMVTWAGIDDGNSCVAFIDTRETPAVVVFIGMKDDPADGALATLIKTFALEQKMKRFQDIDSKQKARRLSCTIAVPDQASNYSNYSAISTVTRGDARTNTVSVFETWYLGSVPVTKALGEEAVEQAIDFMRAQVGHSSNPPQSSGNKNKAILTGNTVTLVVSKEGVRTLDSLTRAVIKNIFIKHITYVSVTNSKEEQEIFSYIAHDEGLDRACCYLYICVSGQSQLICEKIEEAREEFRQEEEDESFHPFLSTNPNPPEAEINPSLLKYQLPRECFAPVKVLGVSQFGRTYLATYTPPLTLDEEGDKDDEQLTVKLLSQKVSEAERNEYLKQVENLIGLDHENVIKLVGMCMLEEPWMTVEEFSQYGNLHTVLLACKEKSVIFRPIEHAHIARQIAAGMAYVASKGLIHMDLATRNITLHANCVVKVGNFSMAMRHDPGTKHYTLKDRLKLSLRWLAVETFAGNPKIFSEASDVWAFGITLWELITYGATPYSKFRLSDVHKMVPEGLVPEKPESCTLAFFNAIAKCWALKPSDRPDFVALEATFKAMQDAHAAESKVRDLGETLNTALISTLKKLSMRASTEHRRKSKARANSQDMDFSSRSSVGGTKRVNPLFSEENELELIFEEEEPESEGGASPELEEVKIIEEEEEEYNGPTVEYQKPVFKLPADCIVVGDINEPIKTVGAKNEIPALKLRGDKKFLSGFGGFKKENFYFLTPLLDIGHKSPAADKVILMPSDEDGNPSADKKEDRRFLRATLMSRNPSSECLRSDPNIFVPSERDVTGIPDYERRPAVSQKVVKRSSNDSLSSVNINADIFK